MTTQVKVDVRVDAATILKWIVLLYLLWN